MWGEVSLIGIRASFLSPFRAGPVRQGACEPNRACELWTERSPTLILGSQVT